MLELKNVTKIYSTKAGEVRALDGVTLSFPETGLVFLLGKSGSGKSTLLNVAGGLDMPTSGEVTVMGKSSKDFSHSDFDSYRNTFIGFVFQEYNVLSEFNVEDNVALALDLQGKSKERGKVEEILETVQLKEFAKRKPKTLSGGQKQRVAIARALVKDPQIIMADEPTGALDSATGEQVFDVLKKLSQTRLVIVVSHDRDFAERYGDRIIELKDGKVVSDTTKVYECAGVLSKGLKQIGENTLSVSGEPTDEMMEKIREFIRTCPEAIITRGENEITAFKRAARIGEADSREHFADTDTANLDIKQYDGSKTKFIRSRLPAKKAFKIGASGLKLKPFRLVMTILLSAISFIMFGLSSTMMLYNEKSVLEASIADSDSEYLIVGKMYSEVVTVIRNGEELFTNQIEQSALFTPAEVKAFGGEGGFAATNVSLYISNITPPEKRGYYDPSVQFFAYIPKGHALDKMEAGRYPEGDGELAVSSYLFECAKQLGFTAIDENGEELSEKALNTPSDLVGERLMIGGDIFTVSGVFDSGEIPKKYDALKDYSDDYILSNDFGNFLRESLNSMAFCTEKVLAPRSTEESAAENFINVDTMTLTFDEDDDGIALSYIHGAKAFDGTAALETVKLTEGELKDDELIVPLNIFAAAAEIAYREVDENLKRALERAGYTYYDPETGIVSTTPAERREAAEQIRDIIKEPLAAKITKYSFDPNVGQLQEERDVAIAGYFIDEDYSYDTATYCSTNFFDNFCTGKTYDLHSTNYVPEEDAAFGLVFRPADKSKAALASVFKNMFSFNERDVKYTLINSIYYSVTSVSEVVGILHTVFLVVGLVLAAFSSLLLFNFISVSISNKKREIGILRAVGARGAEVFGIFFSESGIIVAICSAIAIIGSAVLTFVINSILKIDIGFSVTLFNFGPLSILIMLAAAAVVALAGTFLPVYLTSRKKPVDSIRE